MQHINFPHSFQGRKEGGLMAKIDSAYTYYLSTYGKNKVSRYDTHKKSELRSTYNRIMKLNKNLPLYKLASSKDVKKFAIDIKESARSVQNVIASLTDATNSPRGSFETKIASSSKPDVISVEYVGNPNASATDADFVLSVDALAQPQINRGHFLPNQSSAFSAGSYSFNLNTTAGSYEFQFNVLDSDTNFSTLKKIEKLVNHSNIGLEANVISNKDGASALEIRSEQTGLAEHEAYLFSIYPDQTPTSKHVVDILGLEQVAQEASNSSFTLNNEKHSSFSNTFTVNNQFELTLRNISPKDSSVSIGFKTDADAVLYNVGRLVSSYNSILDTAHQYFDSQQNSAKLYKDIQSASARYKTALSSIGLTSDDTGRLSINHDLLKESVTNSDSDKNFEVLQKFKNTLHEKVNSASLDPLTYVDKLLISYKNSNDNKNFVNPYVVSVYSGLLLDRYV